MEIIASGVEPLTEQATLYYGESQPNDLLKKLTVFMIIVKYYLVIYFGTIEQQTNKKGDYYEPARVD